MTARNPLYDSRWRAPNDHRRLAHRHPDPERPTPREISALRAVEDGCSLTVAAQKLGIRREQVAHILSCVYDRLKVKDLSSHHLSHDRRAAAISICRREGWWPDGDQES